MAAFSLELWVNFQNHVYEEGAYRSYFKNYANVQQQSSATKIRNPAYNISQSHSGFPV